METLADERKTSPAAHFGESERSFVLAAVRRKRLFLVLSLLGVTVAVGLAFYYGYRHWLDPDYSLGVRAVLVLLILLNARQNLRQYRYARVLDKLSKGGAGPLLQSPASPFRESRHLEPTPRERADRPRWRP